MDDLFSEKKENGTSTMPLNNGKINSRPFCEIIQTMSTAINKNTLQLFSEENILIEERQQAQQTAN